ncbi:MAG: hypothetical protein EBT03_11740 [Betaproteobacteria bacterium]|nr:hypothetical protein [Betaproteobacteria bacterium]
MKLLRACFVLSFSILSAILSAPLAGADFPTNPVPAPVLQCTEGCQKFDYTGACTYRTTCLQQGDCMSLTSCARFDFSGACTDSRVTQTCAVAGCPGYPLPAPQFPITCESGCQKRDVHGDCIYTARCEIIGRCIHRTDCERFNNFGDECLSERVLHSCY